MSVTYFVLLCCIIFTARQLNFPVGRQPGSESEKITEDSKKKWKRILGMAFQSAVNLEQWRLYDLAVGGVLGDHSSK